MGLIHCFLFFHNEANAYNTKNFYKRYLQKIFKMEIFSLQEIEYDKDFVEADEKMVFVKKCPDEQLVIENYNTMPEIQGLKKLSKQESLLFFSDILNDHRRISLVNGICNDLWQHGVYCDYCKVEILCDYRYCYCCHTDMCNLCFSETSEEIALQNGAKNFAKRKEILDKCRAHSHRLKVRKNPEFCECDKCEQLILEEEWWGNEKEDFCKSCFKDFDSSDVSLKSHETVNNNQFGSMLDWLRIYEDEDWNSILLNGNKDSQFYGNVALSSIDDHGREGFFTIPMTLDETLSKIKDLELGKDEELTGWDEFYNAPIKKILVSFNCQIHYG